MEVVFCLLPKIRELESTVASASDRFFKARIFVNVMTDWKSDTSHLFGVNIPGLPRGYHPAFAVGRLFNKLRCCPGHDDTAIVS